MSDVNRVQVLICGAGAAGLTLAIDLARRNVPFRIIDKLDGPFRGSRGKGIQPRSQEVLEDLGVLDKIVAIGGEYPPQREYADDGTYTETLIMETVATTPDEPYHIPLLVPQFLTERVLRERLAEFGERVEFGSELVHFDQDADGVNVGLRTGRDVETFRVSFLVGTDGGRSFVRQSLKLDFPGKTLGVRAVVADVTLEGLKRDAWHRWNDGSMERQMSLCPLCGTDMFQLQAPVPMRGDVDVSPAGLTHMVQERTGRRDIVIREVSWGSPYQMNSRLAERYRVGRVLIAGDAAHIHPPTGGQGLNTSMQDAYNLGWKLAAVLNGSPDRLLNTYEEERRPVAEHMLGLATKLLEAARRGTHRRGRETHQLDIGYPESSLGLEAPERKRGILAGDRAPDAPMEGAAGQQVRLFTLTQGSHWTAFGYHAPRDSAPSTRANLHLHHVGPDADLRDRWGHFATAYQLAEGGWVLIRPDGYVGAVVDAANLASLEDYMDGLRIAAQP